MRCVLTAVATVEEQLRHQPVEARRKSLPKSRGFWRAPPTVTKGAMINRNAFSGVRVGSAVRRGPAQSGAIHSRIRGHFLGVGRPRRYRVHRGLRIPKVWRLSHFTGLADAVGERPSGYASPINLKRVACLPPGTPARMVLKMPSRSKPLRYAEAVLRLGWSMILAASRTERKNGLCPAMAWR